MSVVSERLRLARTTKKLSQMDVMRLTKINNKTLSGYENAVSEPDFASLVLLANLYSVTTDYLLGLSPNPAARPLVTDPQGTAEAEPADPLETLLKARDLTPSNINTVTKLIEVLEMQNVKKAGEAS
ncbi:MAG: helix-turn-helix transcriptional regulator [Eubacteriales bacterium]